MDELLPFLDVLKDPRAAVLMMLWLALEVRALRRKVGLLFNGHGDQEARLQVLEDRTGVRRKPKPSPA